MSTVCSHAPYHSALHDEIDQRWACPRRLLGGKVFGGEVTRGGSSREEHFRAVAQQGTREYVDLLREHARLVLS